MNRRQFTRDIPLGLLGLGTLAAGVNSGCTRDALMRSVTFQVDNFPASVFASSSFPLRWEVVGSHRLNLAYSSDGGQNWTEFATEIPAAAGRYDWQVPSNAQSDNLLRLSDADFPEISSLSPPFTILETVELLLAPLEADLAAQGYRLLNLTGVGDVFILRVDEEHYKVLSPICPHLACQVAFNAPQATFNCPCHGSSFSAGGCLLNGPAEEGLTEFTHQFFPDPDRLLIVPNSGRPACS